MLAVVDRVWGRQFACRKRWRGRPASLGGPKVHYRPFRTVLVGWSPELPPQTDVDMNNPYQHLESCKFWRKAVAEKRSGEPYSDIWRPRFEIGRESRILAAGSCFAQHVGRWLSQSGFDFQRSTIAPEHNLSFAFGNIYTAALLRQWLECGLETRDLSDAHAEEEGKYFDVLRPSINSDGFPSLKELLRARQHAIAEMLTSFEAADVFIFTLGLTEAWVHRDGTVYPMCPGVLCGTFDPDVHQFKNYGVDEIRDDLLEVMRLVKAIRTSVRFLFTVSPVPLTATASEHHVLPATIYSKSVLRACVGEMCETRDDVDYFPSYELIASHPSKGRFFESNLRSVSSAGVQFVMAHLEAALNKETLQVQGAAVAATPQRPVPASSAEADDVFCEDLFLERSHGESGRIGASGVRFCLVGDSHMGMLSQSMQRKGITHIGGMIMKGASWATSAFHLDQDEYFVPLESKACRRVWRETLEQLSSLSTDKSSRPVIVSNIGLQTRISVAQFVTWVEHAKADLENIDQTIGFFRHTYAKHVAVLDFFVKAGYSVLTISDPPLQRFYDEGADCEGPVEAYEELYGEITTALGGKYLSTRSWIGGEVGFDAKLCSPNVLPGGQRDWAHGSETYYDLLSDKILQLFPGSSATSSSSRTGV